MKLPYVIEHTILYKIYKNRYDLNSITNFIWVKMWKYQSAIFHFEIDCKQYDMRSTFTLIIRTFVILPKFDTRGRYDQKNVSYWDKWDIDSD